MKKNKLTLDDTTFDEQITKAIAASEEALSLEDPDLAEVRSCAAERHVRTLVAGFSAKAARRFTAASDEESLDYQKKMNAIELKKAGKTK